VVLVVAVRVELLVTEPAFQTPVVIVPRVAISVSGVAVATFETFPTKIEPLARVVVRAAAQLVFVPSDAKTLPFAEAWDGKRAFNASLAEV
jgi:hypothetical protein